MVSIPLDVIEQYGADALRMGLLIGTAIGNDVSFDQSKVKGYKNFANKLWNVTRFVLTGAEDVGLEAVHLHADDQARPRRAHRARTRDNRRHRAYRLYLAGEKIYHYLWHTFADVVLEESKPLLQGDDAARHKAACVCFTICS